MVGRNTVVVFAVLAAVAAWATELVVAPNVADVRPSAPLRFNRPRPLGR
jgi:hypothetical protein